MLAFKGYIYVAILMLLVSMCGYGYYIYNENVELKNLRDALQKSLAAEISKNLLIQKDYSKVLDVNRKLRDREIVLENESKTLNVKLKKLQNRIDSIALKHPQLLGKTLTEATSKVHRCLENISKDVECSE